jgi:hypothetical protein
MDTSDAQRSERTTNNQVAGIDVSSSVSSTGEDQESASKSVHELHIDLRICCGVMIYGCLKCNNDYPAPCCRTLDLLAPQHEGLRDIRTARRIK